MLTLAAGCGRIGFDPTDAVTDAQRDAPVADSSPASCTRDSRYEAVSGLASRYRTGTVDLAWAAAQADCEADGAHLPILDDVVEATAGVLGDWVGVTDAAGEGIWLTVAGAPAPYLPWIPGQPDGGTGENCARLEDGPGKLEDRECIDVRDYSCECP